MVTTRTHKTTHKEPEHIHVEPEEVIVKQESEVEVKDKKKFVITKEIIFCVILGPLLVSVIMGVYTRVSSVMINAEKVVTLSETIQKEIKTREDEDNKISAQLDSIRTSAATASATSKAILTLMRHQ